MRSTRNFDGQIDIERRVNLNSLLAIALAVTLFLLGMNTRNGALNATIPFEDPTNGISAQIPADWLVDDENYVLRAEDLGSGVFNPLLQISVEIVGDNAAPRNIVDQRNLQLSADLNGYTTVAIEEAQLGEDPATRITYAFIASEANPFLRQTPVVVQGVDVVVIRENQALIFTFRDSRENFDSNRRYFDQFLDSVEY